MSETFNYSRFVRFFRYDFRNVVAQYGLTFLILACAPLWVEILYGAYHTILDMAHQWSGPSIDYRIGGLAAIGIVFFCGFPAKAYGFVTEKRAGSKYLLIPASTTEKFVSMMVNCLIVLPVAFLLIYGLSDLLVSLIDPTVGKSLVGSFTERRSMGVYVWDGDVLSGASVAWRVTLGAVFSYFGSILAFLLGALCFKRRKVANTFLILIGISVLLSFAAIEVVNNIDMDTFDGYAPEVVVNCALNLGLSLSALFAFALGAATFLRLKTMKH